MHLALHIVSQQAGSMGPNSSMVFSNAGGTIGRVAGNDWILPDAERFISSRHAIIRFMGGTFWLEDVSTNGTFVNGETEAVGARSEPAVLNNGDRLQIGDYEIYVTIVAGEEDAAASFPQANAPADVALEPPVDVPPVNTPIGSHDIVPPLYPPDQAPPVAPAEPVGAPHESLNPLEQWEDPPIAPPTAPPAHPDHSSAISHHVEIPPIGNTGAGGSTGPIGDDWDKTDYTPGASSGAIPPTPSAMSPDVGFAPTPVSGQLPPTSSLGTVNYDTLMPLIVQGMMDVLRSRSDIKSEFRLALTTIKPIENNPLKFSPTAADAMNHLFQSQHSGYLNAIQAFEEGFNDIKAHQMAMLAGMRAAFEHMLEQFSPDMLEEEFERRKTGGLMKLGSKGRNWDMYREMFETMTRDSDDSFRRLFGEEFATAYERQMQSISLRK